VRGLLSVVALCCALPAAAQEDDLIDYARLFEEHAAEVVPGKDYRGRPGDILNLPDGTTLWRGGPAEARVYSGTSTVGDTCDLVWILIGIDFILQCPEGVPPDQMASVNRTLDQVLTYWGENVYPPRSLPEMRKVLHPENWESEPVDCEALKTDPYGPIALAESMSAEAAQSSLTEELSKPPHLMVPGWCP
jgi:hypothetical protein